MDAQDLIRKLNLYPPSVHLDQKSVSDAYKTISDLSQLLEGAEPEQRKAIATALRDPAKNVMYEYTRAKAVEARRTGSRNAVIEGLIAVVMAGGRSDQITGGSLPPMRSDRPKSGFSVAAAGNAGHRMSRHYGTRYAGRHRLRDARRADVTTNVVGQATGSSRALRAGPIHFDKVITLHSVL